MRKANEIAGAVFQWAVYLTLFGLILFTVFQCRQSEAFVL